MARKTVLRQKDVVIASCLAALNIAAVVLVQILFIAPILAQGRQQARQNAEAVKELETNVEQRRRLQELIEENREFNRRLAAFDKRVPGKSDMSGALEDLVWSADQHGLRIDRTNQSEPIHIGGELARVPYRLDLRGPYHALGQFLSRVESHNNYMQVVNVDLKAEGDDAVRAQVLIYLHGALTDRETAAEGDPEEPEDEPAAS